jgi:hypothetical protein
VTSSSLLGKSQNSSKGTLTRFPLWVTDPTHTHATHWAINDRRKSLQLTRHVATKHSEPGCKPLQGKSKKQICAIN